MPLFRSSFLLLVLTIAMGLVSCQEEESARVEVYVVDQQERGVDKAKVSFYMQPGNSIQEKIIYTDNLGNAVWDFDFVATLTVYGSKDNYFGQFVRDTSEVSLIQGKTQKVKLILRPN